MSFTKTAQNYLDKCRVIGVAEVQEGIVVAIASDYSEYKVSVITTKKGTVNEEVIGVFSVIDFYDTNKSKMVLNFKKLMSEFVGRKKYYIEVTIYNFLADIQTTPDELEESFATLCDDAEERARLEAIEEEEAEENFDRYLKLMEQM